MESGSRVVLSPRVIPRPSCDVPASTASKVAFVLSLTHTCPTLTSFFLFRDWRRRSDTKGSSPSPPVDRVIDCSEFFPTLLSPLLRSRGSRARSPPFFSSRALFFRAGNSIEKLPLPPPRGKRSFPFSGAGVKISSLPSPAEI